MWTYEHSADADVSAAAIFERFSDVATWPEWNPGVEWMTLDGPFATGTIGTMKVPGQDPMRMRLVSVDDGWGFEDETDIPDAGVVVRVRHSLRALDDGRTRIVYGVTIDGPAADTIGPSIGPEITADFPAVIAALIAHSAAGTPPR